MACDSRSACRWKVSVICLLKKMEQKTEKPQLIYIYILLCTSLALYISIQETMRTQLTSCGLSPLVSPWSEDSYQLKNPGSVALPQEGLHQAFAESTVEEWPVLTSLLHLTVQNLNHPSLHRFHHLSLWLWLGFQKFLGHHLDHLFAGFADVLSKRQTCRFVLWNNPSKEYKP